MPTKKHGIKAKAVYSPTHATPTFSVIPGVKDLTLTKTTNEVECTDRDSIYETILSGTKAYEISFTFAYYVGDTTFDAIETAEVAGDPINIGFADEDPTTSGTKVLHFDGEVTKFDKQGPINGQFVVDFACKPTANGGLPKVTTIA
jgi:hypothetical protein